MKKKHNQGFSLVELILAVAILAIIMVAIASFMSTTTRTYRRTKNDTELQRTGQELFDMVSDKIMQATCIRIGTVTITTDADGNAVKSDPREYAILGTNGSTKADADTGKLLKENGADAGMSYMNYGMYTFEVLAEDSTRSVEYITVYYEGNATFGSSSGYGPIIDTYYFDYDSGEVYLYRYNGGVRYRGNDTSTDGKPVQNNIGVSSRDAMDSWVNTTIKPLSDFTDTDLEKHLVCKNVSNIHAYAISDENAIYLQIDLEKGGMTNTSQGMITIRNSYILQPKAPKDSTGAGGSSGSGDPEGGGSGSGDPDDGGSGSGDPDDGGSGGNIDPSDEN